MKGEVGGWEDLPDGVTQIPHPIFLKCACPSLPHVFPILMAWRVAGRKLRM